MTIKENVQIPVWLLTLIISGLIGLFSYSIMFAISYGSMKKDVTFNTESIANIKTSEITNLQDKKADKEQVNAIEQTLIRIENKLDQHILYHGNNDKK